MTRTTTPLASSADSSVPPPWALVTGASSGLGVALATELAARGYRLVLTARSEAALQAVAATLAQRHGTACAVEAIDLGVSGSAGVLHQRLAQRGIEPAVLVNNAGFGISGPFIAQDLARLRSMIELDVMALTELTLLFGRQMRARGQGRILLVASMAGHQPTPMLAAYGAAKAFVVSLGESLNVELAPQVGVTVLSPGLMNTNFSATAGYEAPRWAGATVLAPSAVARIGIDAMLAGRSQVIAGRLNRLGAFLGRFTSRHWQAQMVFDSAAR